MIKELLFDKRVVSALIAIPILFFFTISGGIPFKLFVLLITAIALYEYNNVYKDTEHKIILFVLIIGFIINYILILTNNYHYILPVILLVVLLSMAVPIFSKKYNVISSSLTITGFIYIIVFFSLLILIRDMQYGNSLIWLSFIIAWCCDTLAYYTGKSIGKNKLCPDVSPKKTIEGSIGGIFGSIIGLVIWKTINTSMPLSWVNIVLLGIIGGIVSQIGDLSASLIKRYVGVKDYGKIMPGHGGILDRFDSILFTVPIVYYYIVFMLG